PAVLRVSVPRPDTGSGVRDAPGPVELYGRTTAGRQRVREWDRAAGTPVTRGMARLPGAAPGVCICPRSQYVDLHLSVYGAARRYEARLPRSPRAGCGLRLPRVTGLALRGWIPPGAVLSRAFRLWPELLIEQLLHAPRARRGKRGLWQPRIPARFAPRSRILL